MDIRGLKRSAKELWAECGSALGYILSAHMDVPVILFMVLVNYSRFKEIFSWMPEASGTTAEGLSGLDAQAALATAQIVLLILAMAAVIFWLAASPFISLGCVRRQSRTYGSLLEGFRRFKPILSSSLLQGIQYFAVSFISMYLGSILFMFTPLATPVYEAALKLTQDPSLDIYVLLGASIDSIAVTYSAIYLVVFTVLAAPVFYRFRMVNYLIMDDFQPGGLQAMFMSQVIMKGRRMKLFRLDLSFWWYYGLKLLGVLLCFGVPIMSALGISLPILEDIAHWVFQLLAIITLVALHEFATPKLKATYALAYESLRQPRQPQEPKPPKKQPWNY